MHSVLCFIAFPKTEVRPQNKQESNQLMNRLILLQKKKNCDPVTVHPKFDNRARHEITQMKITSAFFVHGIKLTFIHFL